MGEKRRGFGVVQFLIVVAVVLALAGTGAYLLHSRIAANENEARESLHAYNLALFEYVNIYETYPKALANLGAGAQVGFASAGLIDPVLASGKKNGYVFVYVPGELDFDGTSSTYSITARPRMAGVTGHLSFAMDQTGAIRVLPSAAAVMSSANP